MKNQSQKTASLCLLFLFFLTCSPQQQRGLIVLCAGDSLTESSYPQFLKKFMSDAGIRAKVLNFGRSGNTTGEYLHYLQSNTELLAATRPDFICLLLGTNDVRNDGDKTSVDQSYSQLKEIIALFRQFKNPDGKSSRILLSTIPPVPPGIPFPFSEESSVRAIHEINPLIKRIGKEENIPVVDNTTLFQEEPGLLPDVHPNEEGYRRLAQNWFEALHSLIK